MEDAAILDLYWDRKEEAIKETDAAYGKKLYILANKIAQMQEEAEEGVHNTYWKAWESIPPRRPSYFFAWLAKICRETALNRLEWKQAGNSVPAQLSREMEGCVPARRRGLELEGPELGQLLNQFMGSISQENRQIFMRRYWYMDTTPEIAQRFGISQRRVNTRLRRTRGRLMNFLENEGVYL